MFSICTSFMAISYLLIYVNGGSTKMTKADNDLVDQYLYDEEIVLNFTDQVKELNKQILVNLEKHEERIEQKLTELLQRSENVFYTQLKQELAKQKTAFIEEIKQLMGKCPCAPAQNEHNVHEPSNTNTSVTKKEEQKTQTATKPLPTSCAEALFNNNRNGIYELDLPASDLPPFSVYCLRDPDNGLAWTVIQRRQEGSSNTDFDRNWQDYKNGFGPLEGEFFIGLDALHALTTASPQPQELWIDMVDWEGQSRFARYDSFAIGDEASKYTLTELGQFHGNAGDSLTIHRGQKFSTKDRDNDDHETLNCAVRYPGGWWFRSCFRSHLNGLYLADAIAKLQPGISWKDWKRKDYSLKYVHMAIRPVS